MTLFDVDSIHDPTNDWINAVFDYWVAICRNSNKGVRPKLDDKRRRKIKAAIISHGVDMCKLAIDGCAASEWHNGANPRGKTYNEITLILRDAEHIEQFIDLAIEQKENQEW